MLSHAGPFGGQGFTMPVGVALCQAGTAGARTRRAHLGPFTSLMVAPIRVGRHLAVQVDRSVDLGGWVAAEHRPHACVLVAAPEAGRFAGDGCGLVCVVGSWPERGGRRHPGLASPIGFAVLMKVGGVTR